MFGRRKSGIEWNEKWLFTTGDFGGYNGAAQRLRNNLHGFPVRVLFAEERNGMAVPNTPRSLAGSLQDEMKAEEEDKRRERE